MGKAIKSVKRCFTTEKKALKTSSTCVACDHETYRTGTSVSKNEEESKDEGVYDCWIVSEEVLRDMGLGDPIKVVEDKPKALETRWVMIDGVAVFEEELRQVGECAENGERHLV